MSFSSFGMPDFKMPDMPDMPDLPDMPSSKQLIPSVNGQGDLDIIYRWNDSNGNVHFTTEPPADGIKYTVKGYDPGANVIQAVKRPEIEEPAEPATTNTKASGGENLQPDPQNIYNKEDIKKLFDDSKNIQQLLNQRYNNQNSATNQ